MIETNQGRFRNDISIQQDASRDIAFELDGTDYLLRSGHGTHDDVQLYVSECGKLFALVVVRPAMPYVGIRWWNADAIDYGYMASGLAQICCTDYFLQGDACTDVIEDTYADIDDIFVELVASGHEYIT